MENSHPGPGQQESSIGRSTPSLKTLIICWRNSSLLSSMFPSVMMFSDVRTRANKVALKLTVPSGLSRMFIDTRRLQATR